MLAPPGRGRTRFLILPELQTPNPIEESAKFTRLPAILEKVPLNLPRKVNDAARAKCGSDSLVLALGPDLRHASKAQQEKGKTKHKAGLSLKAPPRGDHVIICFPLPTHKKMGSSLKIQNKRGRGRHRCPGSGTGRWNPS